MARINSEPFNGAAPTVTGMPQATVIQIEPDMAKAAGEEASPSRGPAAAQVGGVNRVPGLLAKWAGEQLDYSKNQTQDILKRCQAALAAKNRSARTVQQNNAARDLGGKIYDSEAADQVDDATGLQKDLIFQDGRLGRVDYGPSERSERAEVVQMALDDQLNRGNVEDETETALHRFILYPYSGYKAVRDFKYNKPCYYLTAVNPQTIAFSDVGRKLQDQYTVHEVHFYTKREMKRAGFKNLEKLGSADGGGRNSILPPTDNSANTADGCSPNETHEVCETWGEPPWDEWLQDGKCTDEELNAFAAEWGFDPQEIDADGNKHCVFHKNNVLLKWHPNYLVEQEVYPYFISSHYPAENRVAGEAQMERVADSHNAVHIILNDWMDNMRMIGNQAIMFRTSSGVSETMLKRLYEPRARVPIPGNDDIETMFHFFKPDNLGNDLMQGLSYFKGRIKEGGIDDVLKGKAKPRTATQSENDNARQQSTINNSGTRFVRQALKPALRAVMQMIIANYSRQDWHEIAGEEGGQMVTEPWMIDPCAIDKHFQIVPVATFDFQSQGQKIQEIVNVVNVFGAFLNPLQIQAAFEEVLRMTSLKKHQIDKILDSVGTSTDALEEIETMIDNPWTEPEVRPEDDHQTALLVANVAIQQYPQLMQQTSFQRWMLKHQLFAFQQLQQQMAEQEAAAQQRGGDSDGDEPQGKQKQAPAEGGPTDSEGQVRQQAQLASPPDQMAMAGATGAGSMPGM